MSDQASELLPLWWLSFCDASKPSGSQFLGLVLVRGVDMVQALKVAHILGINPGGEASGIACDPAVLARLSFDLEAEYANRLIGKEEALILQANIKIEIGD